MDRKEHIGFELRLIQNLICERMKEGRESDSVGMTQLQHLIIRFLDENQGREVYQRDIESAFHTSRATISNTLQVMERNGLIVRRQVAQDARLKCLELTERSRELSRRAKEKVEQTEQLLRKGMTTEEVAVFRDLLQRVRTNLEEEKLRAADKNRQEEHNRCIC